MKRIKATLAEQKAEAVRRMKMLHLHPAIIKDFEDNGKLFYSDDFAFPVGLTTLSANEMQTVTALETRDDVLIYHAVHTTGSNMISFLYVSAFKDEWKNEREDIKLLNPIAYVKNKDENSSPEFEEICILPKIGGLVRTA